MTKMDVDSDSEADLSALAQGLLAAPAAVVDSDDDQQDHDNLVMELMRVHQAAPAAGLDAADPGGPQAHRAHTVNFGDPRVLCKLGSTLQTNMFNHFRKQMASSRAAKAATPTSSAAAVVVDTFIKSTTLVSAAAAAQGTGHHRATIALSLERVGCLILHGAAWMIGAMLAAWRIAFERGGWVPVAIFSKMKYDETPLKMKVQEYNEFLNQKQQRDSQSQTSATPSAREAYRFAKIFRAEWQLNFVVSHGRQHYQVNLNIPTLMSAIERNTSECIVSVFEKIFSLVPELGPFWQCFPTKIRIPTMDRYSANFRAERHLRSWSSGISVPFVCDVHKESSCVKRGLYTVAEDTMSGLVNLALALEAAGALNGLRKVLQNIFEESLVIAYTPPGDEQSPEFKHRLGVYDLFLPLTSAKNKKRRFVLQTLANSDLQISDIVHHCVFGCCEDAESTRKHFVQEVTEALLPCKLKVLNRKSWTGADTTVQWAGLLHSHWHLLPRILLRYLSVNREPGRPCDGDGDGLEDIEVVQDQDPQEAAGFGGDDHLLLEDWALLPLR